MKRATRILIVDDSPEIRALVGIALKAQPGWLVHVSTAGDGLEALDEAANAAPDAVVLDVGMPRMNGIEALPRLRRLLPDAVIVMFTADEAIPLERLADADAAIGKRHGEHRLRTVLFRLLTRTAEHLETHASRAGQPLAARPPPAPEF